MVWLSTTSTLAGTWRTGRPSRLAVSAIAWPLAGFASAAGGAGAAGRVAPGVGGLCVTGRARTGAFTSTRLRPVGSDTVPGPACARAAPDVISDIDADRPSAREKADSETAAARRPAKMRKDMGVPGRRTRDPSPR